MSWYTTTAVTVRPDKADALVDALRKAESHEDFVPPTRAVRHPDGSLTLLWKDRNHFPNGELHGILVGLMGKHDYCMTVVDEDMSVETFGSGDCCHEAVATIEIWVNGEEVEI